MINYLIGFIELSIFSFLVGVIFLWISKGTHPYKTIQWFFGFGKYKKEAKQ